MPWITFYAAILKPKLFLIVIVAFGWIFTLINLIQTYLFYAGRILWSWSLDRVVPDWIVGSNTKHPTPSRSIIVIAILALIGVVDAAYGGPLGTQLTFAFFAVVTQVVPVTALTLLPILHRPTFENLPTVLRREIFGIPLSSLAGGITLIYLVWMIVASFLYPAAGVAAPTKTLGLLIGFLVSGLLVFEWSRKHRLRTMGLDIMNIYRKAP